MGLKDVFFVVLLIVLCSVGITLLAFVPEHTDSGPKTQTFDGCVKGSPVAVFKDSSTGHNVIQYELECGP